ncbi:hypothetical protein PVK62_16800 [Aliivibrio sp. S3MY1]|jgi:hypothetical protein|uniref:hypothetical protein n=1 Tax=unclassified Aliivibrio TaxID=2645654 RepID=UPI0023794C46|nr:MULTISPECIES: hypothetical protein [unclassified Aliivibrio]MDD9197486.1 hypothetical protein [Aliivibrio sp. S3MY1]MDD9200733.1 hypothetical protein [Aliivibrio sp. S2MY1]
MLLDWLNDMVGTDWATYVGVFLTVIGLLVGSKTIKKIKQKQAIKNGTGIQSGGDVNITIVGKDK